MNLKEKIANGLLCAGLISVLSGGCMDLYKKEQVKASVAMHLELDESERVSNEMIDQFPELRDQYDDKTILYHTVFPGYLLLGIGLTGFPYRGVPGWTSWGKRKEETK